MAKMEEMPIRQEKVLSSEFHMQMLQELESHHDEKSRDWSRVSYGLMVEKAFRRVTWIYLDGISDPKQLVHAANELAIAWAILTNTDPDLTPEYHGQVLTDNRVADLMRDLFYNHTDRYPEQIHASVNLSREID